MATTAGKTEVFCPGCGEKVEVSVVVKKVEMSSTFDGQPTVEVEFDGRWAAHECLEVATDG